MVDSVRGSSARSDIWGYSEGMHPAVSEFQLLCFNEVALFKSTLLCPLPEWHCGAESQRWQSFRGQPCCVRGFNWCM